MELLNKKYDYLVKHGRDHPTVFKHIIQQQQQKLGVDKSKPPLQKNLHKYIA